MKVKVPSWKMFEYYEVFEILEYRDGYVFKTKTTGKFVRFDWVNPDPKKWKLASCSTSLLKQDEAELELFEG